MKFHTKRSEKYFNKTFYLLFLQIFRMLVLRTLTIFVNSFLFSEASNRCSRLARVRGANLPQENQLLRFFAGISNPHHSWKTDVALNEWRGVRVDEAGNVVKLIQVTKDLKGNIRMAFLPDSVTELLMSHNYLSGTVELEMLPSRIEIVALSSNLFVGEVNLCQLPVSLKELFLRENHFEGLVDFSYLHEGLIGISLNGNRKLYGEVIIKKLPQSLKDKRWFGTQIVNR